MSTPHGNGPERASAGGGPAAAAPPALIGSGWAPSAPPRPTAAAPQGGGPAGDEPAREAARPPAREPREPAEGTPTTVLPGAGAGASPGTASVRRPGGPRPAPSRPAARAPESRSAPKSRRARLALQRIDPWSVFTYTLVASVFLGIALVVAAFVLYSVLGALGVPDTVNELYTELTDEPEAILTSGRVLSAAAVLAAVNVVLLTLLATLGALLYNLCASFTGGIELTLGERDG